MSTPGASAGPAKVLDLAQVSPPRLFFALLHQRFTGVLQLNQPTPNVGQRTVWFSGGMPVFTDWSEQTEVLGQVLISQRVLDEARLMQGLQAMAESGGLLGQNLLQLQLIDEASLGEGLRRQCGRKLVHVFDLREEQVTVTACDHTLMEMAKVNVLELILTAVGKHYDEARILAEMGPALEGPVRATGAYTRYQERFRFRPTDEPLLTALLKGTSIEQLVAAGASRKRAAQLIYVLWACQMLRVGAAASKAPTTKRAPPGRPRTAPRATPQVTPPVDPEATRRAATTETPRRRGSEPSRAATGEFTSTPAAKPSPETQRPTSETPVAAAQTKRSTKEMAGDEKSFIADVELVEAKIEEGAHAFELLGVTSGAGRREIRKRWADLSRRLHPDALQAKGWGHLRDRVGNVFAALSEAHTLLSDKEQREKLAEKIDRGDDTSSDADASAAVRAAFESELVAKEADRFLKAAKFDRALTKFDEALALNPTEPDFIAAAVWCRYQISPHAREDAMTAERELALVIKEAPALARAHFFRGMVLKDLDRIEHALAAFHQALHHDARLIDAERQIRALRLKR